MKSDLRLQLATKSFIIFSLSIWRSLCTESSASPVIRSFPIDDLRQFLRRLMVLKLRSFEAIGVRGGGSAAPPGLKSFSANSAFRASAIVAQKSWMIKNISIQ